MEKTSLNHKPSLLCILPVLLLILGGTALFGASRYVSTAGNDNSGTNTCTSQATPCRTLTNAINQAAAGDTISADAGTYAENLTLTKDLTIKGASLGTTIIDGLSIDRVLTVQVGVTATISELTIMNGLVSAAGAGIYNEGSLTVKNCVVEFNTSNGNSGGGIYNVNSLTIESSFLFRNQATAGGAIYNSSSAQISDTVISGNTVTSSGYGGGIYSVDADLTLTNVTFNSNSAGRGAGIYNLTQATLDNVTFTRNSATEYGGGILNGNGGDATFKDVFFNANSAQYGGGVYNGAAATFENVTFSNNTAQQGGGMYNDTLQDISFTNVTFSSNASAGNGGGLYNHMGTANLTNVTFGANWAASGGGVFNEIGTVNLTNTIVANSLSGANCIGTVTSLGHNLDSENSCGFLSGGDQVNADAKLRPLAAGGNASKAKKGYTPILPLMKGSPAIDKGTNSVCPNKDQRGVDRPQDGDSKGKFTCDIGAYEKDPSESF